MLTKVSLTGADDQVDPQDLVKLSAEFPFVEWGILFSTSRQGTPRYPSEDWVRRLVEVSEGLNLAAHFCGQYMRDTMEGNPRWIREMAGFQRIQINMATYPSIPLSQLAWGMGDCGFEFILQAKPETLDVVMLQALLMGRPHASILYDPSGGRGVEVTDWPPAPPAGIPMGFAGGIKPENVVSVLEAIGKRPEPFWIDMESGIRTDDRFDLAKCRAVLETCRAWI